MTKRTEMRAPCTKLATAGSSLSSIDKFPCPYSALTVLLTPVRCPTHTLAPADFNCKPKFLHTGRQTVRQDDNNVDNLRN